MAKQGGNFDKTIRALLKPILRFCLKRGLRFQEIIEILKLALTDAAQDEINASGHTVNISRLSILSGLHRRDIRKIQDPASDLRPSVNLISRVIGQWQSHPDFLQKNGSPKPLTYQGADSEFADLVKTVSADMNPYTILFALEQAAAVKKDSQKLSLIENIYTPKAEEEQSLEMLAADSAALIKSIEANIFERSAVPNLHITTTYDNLCLKKLPEIREWILDRGTTFHEEVRSYLAQFDKDANPRLFKEKGGGQVSVTAFSLTEDLSGAKKDV